MAFAITGRGTAVVGTLSGMIPSSPVTAVVEARGKITLVPHVSVELVRLEGHDRVALLLRDTGKDAVPEGSVVRSTTADT